MATLLALLLACAGPARAAASAGASSFEFLSLDSDARSAALGGAYTALSADANALRYNPAGLAEVSRHMATVMHNTYFEGMSQQHIGYASPLGIGASINRFSFGDVQRRTVSNPGGTGLGKVGLTSLALEAGYGRALTDTVNAGAGLKLVRESIDQVTAQAFALDLGVLYRSPDMPLRLGLSLRNLGPKAEFLTAKESLPREVRAGAAMGLELFGKRQTLSLDLGKKGGGSVRLAAGVEALLHPSFPLRLGFNTANEAGSGLSAGFGWAAPGDLKLDYAFVPFGDLGTAHRMSLSFAWGGSGDGGQPRFRVRTAANPSKEEEVRTHMDRAWTFFGEQRWDEASGEWMAALAKLQEDDPRVVQSLERLGAAALKLGRMPVAQVYYQKAIDSADRQRLGDISTLAAYLGRAHCLEAAGRKIDALRDYERALRLNPDERTRRAIEKKLQGLRTSMR